MRLLLIQVMVALAKSEGGTKFGLLDAVIIVSIAVLIGTIPIGIALFARQLMKQPLGAGRTWLDYGPLWIVGLGIVASLLGFLVVVLSFVARGTDVTLPDVLALLAALFGIIGTLVGTYFGIRTSLETHEGLLKLAQSSGNAQPPMVSAVDPQEGAKVTGKRPPVSAMFSKPIVDATINADTFKLVSVAEDPPTPIAGKIEYDPSSWRATFTPSVDLARGVYQATITTGVKDQEGTALASEHTWKFTVK